MIESSSARCNSNTKLNRSSKLICFNQQKISEVSTLQDNGPCPQEVTAILGLVRYHHTSAMLRLECLLPSGILEYRTTPNPNLQHDEPALDVEVHYRVTHASTTCWVIILISK